MTFFQRAVVLPDLRAHRRLLRARRVRPGRGRAVPLRGEGRSARRPSCARSIGPVWDGNEVWLLTAGGALFAAFAPAYAATFCGFYLAVMLVLFGLIVRAVSLEYRGHDTEVGQGVGRLLLRGVALAGAAVWALPWATSTRASPWSANGDYMGIPLLGLITPFTLLCGLLGLARCSWRQGAAWLALKAPKPSAPAGACRVGLRLPAPGGGARAVRGGVGVRALRHPAGHGPGARHACAGCSPILAVGGIVGLHRAGAARRGHATWARSLRSRRRRSAWWALLAASMFPNLVVASAGSVGPSITLMSAASSELSLMWMTIITCVGLPLVLVYHVIIYRTFRGRIEGRRPGALLARQLRKPWRKQNRRPTRFAGRPYFTIVLW